MLTTAERAQLEEAMAKQSRLRQMYAQQQSSKQRSENRDNARSTRILTPFKDVGQAVMSNDPAVAGMKPPAPVICEFCGRPRYTKGILLNKRVLWCPTGAERCTCQEAQAQAAQQDAEKEAARQQEERKQAQAKENARIEELFGHSGMGARFKHRTFEKFRELPENARALKTFFSYAQNFSRLLADPENYEKNSLFITGSKGTGKTHLAAAVANKLLAGGTPVLFITMIDLLAKIKATFNAETTSASEARLMQLYKNVDLLIIDDMGKELPTPWALAKMYEIVNARYEGYKPMIITSNYTAEELIKRLTPKDGDSMTAGATVDRILEMTYTVPIAGESWRTKCDSFY